MDATKGYPPHKHAAMPFIALLAIPGIQRVLAAVNKLDLVDYREEVFLRVEQDFLPWQSNSGIPRTRSACQSVRLREITSSIEAEHTYWYQGH